MRTFDLMLGTLERQSLQDDDLKLDEVKKGLDDFVKDALGGAER